MELITRQIRDTAAEALDALMKPKEEGGLGKRCRLIFDPRKTRCPNCTWDSANRRSAHHHRAGGPQPFPDGSLCPVCGGKGTLDTAVTEDVVLLCNWNPRTWVALPGLNPANVNVEVPGGMVQTKGFLKDLPKVLQARKMVVQSEVEQVTRFTYALDGEPIDPGNIIQARYFIAMWKRAGA